MTRYELAPGFFMVYSHDPSGYGFQLHCTRAQGLTRDPSHYSHIDARHQDSKSASACPPADSLTQLLARGTLLGHSRRALCARGFRATGREELVLLRPPRRRHVRWRQAHRTISRGGAPDATCLHSGGAVAASSTTCSDRRRHVWTLAQARRPLGAVSRMADNACPWQVTGVLASSELAKSSWCT